MGSSPMTLPADRRPEGVHLEGPYLSEEQRGAHPARLLRKPSDGSWRDFLDDTDLLRMITVAPELPGSGELITVFRAAGVVVSAGHSTAGVEVLDRAAAAGLSHVAHLWSAQSTLQRMPRRYPGLLEAALSSDTLTAEIIADGAHLTSELVRIAFRCLGPDRLCLISDASAGTGLPVGAEFSMGGPVGVVGDGVALNHDGASFCGSTSFLADVLRFTVRSAGVPLPAAVRMATATPAAVLGLAGVTGRLAPGLRADLLVLGRDLALRRVMRRGAWIPGR